MLKNSKNNVRFIESFTTEDDSTRLKEAGQIWTNVVIVCKVKVASILDNHPRCARSSDDNDHHTDDY